MVDSNKDNSAGFASSTNELLSKFKRSQTVMSLGIGMSFFAFSFTGLTSSTLFVIVLFIWLLLSQCLFIGGGIWKNSIINRMFNVWFNTEVLNQSYKNLFMEGLPAIICFPLWIFYLSVIQYRNNISEVIGFIIFLLIIGSLFLLLGFYLHWVNVNKSKGNRSIYIRHNKDEGYAIVQKSLEICHLDFRFIIDTSLLMLRPREMRIIDTDITLMVYPVGQKEARIEMGVKTSKDIQKAGELEDVIVKLLFQSGTANL